MKNNKENIVIEASCLNVGYITKKKNLVISEGINFSIKQGELIGLVGTNGIGKSTLLRTLAGMQPLLEGVISINGKTLNNISASELASDLSVVLTETPASQNLSVLELVSLGRHPYTNWVGSLSENDQEIINTAISSTKIEELLHKKCYELSDGQLQKVLIARALAQNTPIILLDEPTTHLDIFHRASVLKLLKKLASKNEKTILFSTHEIDLAIQVSDKMLVMTKGNTFFNTPDNLISQGCFNDLFPEEIISFDTHLKRFVLK
ncbi:MAG: ABC transporter ATP-binding protein [Flavobacteriaceae bacterium]|nr:ABC transporter ATP-binding protein [Flavobacteriaceae bacterium]